MVRIEDDHDMCCMSVCVVLSTLDLMSSSIAFTVFCNYYNFSYFYSVLYFTGHTIYKNLKTSW